MIYLQLFLTFLKIGAFTFGGGYAMIAIIRESVLKYGWLTEAGFMDMIAVSESTPGPIAINMATFIGAKQGGLLGSLVATLGVILPSFIIILLIAVALKKYMKYGSVEAVLTGVRPTVSAMISATGIIMALKAFLGLSTLSEGILYNAENTKNIIIFLLIIAFAFVYRKVVKKKASSTLIIGFSAILGMLFFGFSK